MSEYIHKELFLFFQAVTAGAFFLIIHDSLMVFRNVVPHKKWVTGVEEIIFYGGCTWIIFFLADKENKGVIREYLLVGMLIGAWLNWKTLHIIYLKILLYLWTWNVKCVKKMRNRLLFLIKQCKIYWYKFAKMGKIGENRFQKAKRGSKIERQREGTRRKIQRK